MSLDSTSSEVTYTSISFHGDPLAWAPYVVADSPIALSPGYVADSDPEKDIEEDPEEESEDGPVDYPADGGDGDDDDSFDDDNEEEKASGEEEDKHLAPADSVVTPVVDHVERLLALPPPPPSPLISLSPPSVEERLARCLAAPVLPSSPLPIVPHPYGSPNHVRAPPGFRAAMGRLRASSPSTHHPLHPSPPLQPLPSSLHLPPHVPTSLPLPSSPLSPLPASLFIPPLVDRREDTPEAELPPRKRLCLIALTSRYERAKEVGCKIRDTWVDPKEAAEEIAPVTLKGVNTRVTELAANNMPPRISSATTRAAATAAASATATPMTAAAVEHLIEARVSAALANHETL
ncbi:hypothetical protein Tco_1134275 [Tanacetum coccineum]